MGRSPRLRRRLRTSVSLISRLGSSAFRLPPLRRVSLSFALAGVLCGRAIKLTSSCELRHYPQQTNRCNLTHQPHRSTHVKQKNLSRNTEKSLKPYLNALSSTSQHRQHVSASCCVALSGLVNSVPVFMQSPPAELIIQTSVSGIANAKPSAKVDARPIPPCI